MGCGLLVVGYWLLVRMQIDRTVYLTIIPTTQKPKTKNQQPKTNNQKPKTPIIKAMDYFYSSAFTECIHRHEIQTLPKVKADETLTLKIKAPQLRPNQYLALCGNVSELGRWQERKALKLYYTGDNEWTALLNIRMIAGFTIEMKFLVYDEDPNVPVIWEARMNRTFQIPMSANDIKQPVYLEDAHFPIPADRLAGTAVPVFSLRSEGSFGVGDFGDLKKMVDWVALTGQRILQVLPINDTTITHTWTDSYPYSSISIFALHPQYADLRQLPAIKDAKKRAEFEALREELNALPQIDYERVNNAKTEYLHIIFEQEGHDMLASNHFKSWFKEEEKWLVPYAQYCVFRDQYGTADYSRWPDHNLWNEADRHSLSDHRTKEYALVAFYYFVQYVLAQQMIGAHEYARQHKVVLKGDIPIGVNRYGCDVWMEPRYFNLNGQAGAPPDNFSVNGQNWGFPTYNWDEMLKDGCQWWVHRFSNMAKYFDAYRIDHVLGFFRIWEIPVHSVHGLLGQFSPSLGMTRQEVEQYGLRWQEDFFLNPFITDWVLDRYFGQKAQYVKDTFLTHWHDDMYLMREGFKTQREVEAYFDAKGTLSEDDINMRDTLYSLISNVLFLRDHSNPDLVHPRISAQLDPCYETLWDHDKAAFNALYNDYFYRRNNQFWYEEAMKKLPRLVDATKMLVCAEDLGMVPDCVAWVMNQLHILSLEIQSMPKDPKVTFGVLNNNPFLSVCTISSHDTATLRMWWDEDWDRTQQYWNCSLGRYGAAPHPLSGDVATDIVRNHLYCPSMLCILTLQDWLATDENIRLADASKERINIPANPKHYWRYRMHITLEQLIKQTDFNNSICDMISQSRP